MDESKNNYLLQQKMNLTKILAIYIVSVYILSAFAGLIGTLLNSQKDRKNHI